MPGGLDTTHAAALPLRRGNPQNGETPRAAELRLEATQAALTLAQIDGFDRSTALAELATRLQAWLGCDRVIIGLADSRGKTCRVETVSGQARLDRRSEAVKALERALDETLDRDGLAAWPVVGEFPLAALTYNRVAAALGCSGVVGAPLVDPRGNRVGAVLALGGAGLPEDASVLNRLTAAAPLWARYLALLRDAHSSVAGRLARDVKSRLRRRTAQIALLAAAALAVLLATPVTYRLPCECVIEPVVRRHVVAPFAGRLEFALVEPGDVVQQGQPLARMDEQELRWELTGLSAEYEQAQKGYDAALAARTAGAAQVALLEMQQLAAKMQMLEARQEQLTIASPLAGVVTRGDLERSAGAPLTVGQTLFEIAPLDEMVVEIAVPEHEVRHFQPGAEVSLGLHAFPGRTWSGTLDRIHPRAEIRDDANVFIAEMKLPNPDDRLRPGMQGWAKITGPRRKLGWIWLHRPWEALRSRLHL
jgi:RND family efflux transporter MFP subunit